MTGKEQTWFSLLCRVACSATRWDYVTLRLETRYKTWIVTHWRLTWSSFSHLRNGHMASGDRGLFYDDCQLFYQLIAVDEKSPCYRLFFTVFGATLLFVLRGSFRIRRLGSVQMWCYADDENSCMLLVMRVLSIVPLDMTVRVCTGLAHYG